jgi:adenylate cyclase
MAHAALSFMRQMSGEWDLAISEGHIAIALNPNSIWSMVAVGHALGWGGYQREGVDYLRRAMRASPHDPLKWLCTYWTGIFHYFSREYEAAIDTMREIIHVRPAFAYRWIAAGLGQLNRCIEGNEAMEKSIAASAASFEAASTSPVDAARRLHPSDGRAAQSRLAGLTRRRGRVLAVGFGTTGTLSLV